MALADIGRRLRPLSESAMPSTLLVVADGPDARDEFGGSTPGAQVVKASSKCRLRPLSGAEQVTAGQLSSTVEAAVDCPVGVEVGAADTLMVDGAPFNIRYVEPGSEPLMDCRTILVASG